VSKADLLISKRPINDWAYAAKKPHTKRDKHIGSRFCVKEEMAASISSADSSMEATRVAASTPLLHAPASSQSSAGPLVGPSALPPALHTSALALLQAVATLEVSACQQIAVKVSNTWVCRDTCRKMIDPYYMHHSDAIPLQ